MTTEVRDHRYKTTRVSSICGSFGDQRMIAETDARKIAWKAVLDETQNIGWDIRGQTGWMPLADPKFVSCDVVQEDEKATYVLKGYLYLEQTRPIGFRRFLHGGGDVALVLVLVKLDAKTGEILVVDCREREYERGYSPSVEKFDEDWGSVAKEYRALWT
jgi:hypothetical protein